VAITTDMWTSINNDDIATFTCHFFHNNKLQDAVLDTKSFGTASHTSENIYLQMMSVFDEFKITDEVKNYSF
jgi:hypothetical protein